MQNELIATKHVAFKECLFAAYSDDDRSIPSRNGSSSPKEEDEAKSLTIDMEDHLVVEHTNSLIQKFLLTISLSSRKVVQYRVTLMISIVSSHFDIRRTTEQFQLEIHSSHGQEHRLIAQR